MEAFNCLDEGERLEGAIFLEASAGTGKTFAIEHVVLRLIEKGFSLDEILLVTFTRAATRDLRGRIHQLLRSAGRSAASEGEIFTIHSFCHRMLAEFSFEAGVGFELSDPDQVGGGALFKQAALDLLRSLKEEVVSGAQLYQVMRFCGHDLNSYVERLKGCKEGAVLPPYREAREALLELLGPSDELEALISSYKGCMTRDGKFHRFVKEQLEAVGRGDIESLIRASNSLSDLLVEENAKKGAPPLPNRWRRFFDLLKEMRLPEKILARLSELTRARLKEGEEGSPDMLLTLMKQSIAKEGFAKKVRSKYRALIVDEFQDTDNLQWEIFRELFFGHVELFLVVGDPKQSIYSFRGSDLNTFLRAKESFS